MLKKIAFALFVLLIGGGLYLYFSIANTARGGSGYAAKNICSGHFLSGFSPETVFEQALGGASGPLARLTYDVDAESGTVTTRLYGLFERRAVFTPGIGCTLLPSGVEQGDLQVALFDAPPLPQDQAWPNGSGTPDLQEAFSGLIAEAFTEEDPNRLRHTKAVVVVHRGKLIAERYAEGVTFETTLLGWSMAKSVTAIMIGLLVGEERLQIDESAPVPLWRSEPNDPRAEITLDQLLRMSSALEFDETYTSATDVTQMLSNEPDMAAFAAAKPLVGAPDTIWSYSSGTSNILSAIIKSTVGGSLQSYYTFSQSRLFGPLGIRTATFEPDYSGNFVGSSYLYASARDWARLGQLCLQNGVWNEQQLLPEGWVDYLIRPTPTTSTNEYGAQFWLNRNSDDPERERHFPGLPEDAYYMSGFQGQIVLVIPSHDLVITRFGFSPARNHGIEQLAASIIEALPIKSDES